MDLHEFRDALLRLDRPDEVLELADSYLKLLEEMGDSFILPKKHEIVKPALEYYADDLEGWVSFVRGVRDRLPMRGTQFNPKVNALYRTLELRLVQRKQRLRQAAAVDVAVHKHIIEDTFIAKVQFAKRCAQDWKLRRDRMLKTAANQCKRGILTMAEREVLLREFWLHVDEEIANGEVSKP